MRRCEREQVERAMSLLARAAKGTPVGCDALLLVHRPDYNAAWQLLGSLLMKTRREHALPTALVMMHGRN
jgi:hypothetical protein